MTLSRILKKHTTTLALLLLPTLLQAEEGVRAPVQNLSADGAYASSPFAQLEEIREQLKQLRGDIEQLQFENARINDKFAKFIADVDFRFNEAKPATATDTKLDVKSQSENKEKKSASVFDDLDKALSEETKTTSNTTASSTMAPTRKGSKDEKPKDVKPATDTPNNTKEAVTSKPAREKQQYQEAYEAFKEKDYDKAQIELQKFVEEHPKGELAAKSHYWLAEIYYSRKQYDKAATSALKSYQTSNSGPNAADSLFRLGQSMTKLHKNKEACTVYAKLKNDFPKLDTSIMKQVDGEIGQLKCP